MVTLSSSLPQIRTLFIIIHEEEGEIPFVLPVFISATEMEWNTVGKKLLLSNDILVS